MSGHLDGPPPGPPDPPYIPGDLGAPSAEEFARRRASPTPEERNPYAPSADWKPGQDTFTSQAAGIWAEGFAAGRAAASPDPPDAHTVCVEALTEWWTGEATAAEVTGWMNGALQAARLPELDRTRAISMCNMVMADLGGECDYGAVVSNVLRVAYPAASPDPPPCRCPDDWRYDDGSVFCPRHSTEPNSPGSRIPDQPESRVLADVDMGDDDYEAEARLGIDGAYTCSGCDTIHVPAASPDERLREATFNDPLAEANMALLAYSSAYGKCPGIEIEPGVTSGCRYEGNDDCPTCAALRAADPPRFAADA